MSLAIPSPRTRVLIVGKTGRGKSSRAKELLREWLRRGVRVVAVDPQNEYSRHGRHDGLVQTGPLRNRCTDVELARHPGLLNDRRLSLSVVPSGHDFRAWARCFLLVAKLARSTSGHLVLLVDEVGSLTDSSIHPDCHKAGAELSALCATGRHKGIALVMLSQRMAMVPASARAQVTDLLAFQQDDQADLDALAVRAKSKAFADEVAGLPPFRCAVWSDAASDAAPPQPPALRAV